MALGAAEDRAIRSVWPHVVIVGGGFGGLYAARALACQPVRVTLVDSHNYHLFQPLLYQVASAALSPGDIAEPIRRILRRSQNVRVRLDEVQGIDADGRAILLTGGARMPYDYLILAAGARHSYFGHEEWEAVAPGLKSLEDALEIRRRIFSAFEAAEKATDPDERAALLTFVIVGGGPTGVELAGSIAEIARHTVRGDFRAIDPARARVVLIEGGPRILPPYPPSLSRSARATLERLGVEVRTDRVATLVTDSAVYLGDEVIPTRTTLWAAGVAASPLGKQLGVDVDRAGRVPVEPDLSVAGHPDIFVIGDMALFTHDPSSPGKPLPGVAPVAMQQGEAAAHNVARAVAGAPRVPFHYWNRGSLATIGRAAAVADLGRLQLSGLPAWLAWLFVHVFFLIGFDNRLSVMLQWTWSYLTYDRGARLITGPWRPQTSRPPEGEAGPQTFSGRAPPRPGDGMESTRDV